MSSRLSETIGKLKGKSGTTSNQIPSFRFNKADEEMFEIFDNSSMACSEMSTKPFEENYGEFSDRNKNGHSMDSSDEDLKLDPQPLASSSPTKEAALTKFTPTHESWINQMKGRITKTVEEKYTEYKIEKEKRHSQRNNNALISSTSLDLDIPESEAPSSPVKSKDVDSLVLSHSVSDNSIVIPQTTDNGETSSLASSTTSTSSKIEAPSKELNSKRSKFNFSFRSSPSRTSTTSTISTTTPSSSEVIVTSEVTPVTSTPTKTLKQRMMHLMGKSSSASIISTTTSSAPISMRDLHDVNDDVAANDEDFEELSGIDADDNIETAIEADELFNPSRPGTPVDSVDAKATKIDGDDDNRSFFAKFKVIALLPIVIIVLVQLLPLHHWLTGFLTGMLIGVPGAFYLSLKLFQDDDNNLSSFTSRRLLEIPKAIIIQEEMQKRETWMNLWPSKYGKYDPLTYDVRRTVSVRAELYGSWVELRFPKKNIPLRRMHDEVEPDVENLHFYDHKEVIDLTTAHICLMPENLPSKRMWSKKYPIQIRTHVRKAMSVVKEEPEIFSDAVTDVSNTTNNEDEEYDEFYDEDNERRTNATTEPSNSLLMIPDEDSKTYYLFTRTSREKEEWYSRFRAAAGFMKDWQHQNPEPGHTIDLDYSTFKEREQTFKMFMEDYLQAKTVVEAREKMGIGSERSATSKEELAFINIFGARMWFDLHKSKEFIDFIRDKITRKLLKVKIAQYFEEVSVTTLDLGPKLPQILGVSLPWQDELGLWVDLELEYRGVCQATVETQGIRLPSKDEPDREAQELSRQAAVMDSDEEDSAEEDDDVTDIENADALLVDCSNGMSLSTTPGTPIHPGSGGGGSAVGGVGFRARVLDSILKSDFVAKVAETEWVKKNITGKNITLKLQLHSLKGVLTLNFPPEPSDRIWYGFRSPPTLDIALRPCFGGKSLGKYEGTISTVMKLLEKRLKQEFMKVLVYPNMDDEVLTFMNHVPYSINHD